MPVAPRELQVEAQLPHPPRVPKRVEESPGIQHGPQTPGFCTARLFPTQEGGTIAPVPTPRWPGAGPFRTAALLPPARSRRDEGPRCSRGAGRGHS